MCKLHLSVNHKKRHLFNSQQQKKSWNEYFFSRILIKLTFETKVFKERCLWYFNWIQVSNFTRLARGSCCAVVDKSPHQRKVKGSSISSAAGTGWGKMAIFLTTDSLQIFFWGFKQKKWSFYSAVQQCNSAVVQKCSSAVLQQCSSATVQ